MTKLNKKIIAIITIICAICALWATCFYVNQKHIEEEKIAQKELEEKEAKKKEEEKAKEEEEAKQKEEQKAKEQEEAKKKEEEEAALAAAQEEVIDYYVDYNTNTVTYYTSGGGSYTQTLTDGSQIDFASQGVLYDGDTRYTYYSSNVAYHYQTSEWNLGDDGIYRTNEGYVVVASSDYPQGTVIETPFGTAQVLDTGCSSGTVDIYTGF